MATKFYGQAEAAANNILNAFRENRVPAALASVFIHRHDNAPCRKWSWSNQLLAALAGTSDARGFRQWEEVERKVKKGAKAFYILGPCTRKIETTNSAGEKESRTAVYGFKSIPVFAKESTEGAELPDDTADREFFARLPMREVAESWGLRIGTFNGEKARVKGKYLSRTAIALGVEDLSTWAHELIHAADDRCVGGLKGGQHLDQEIVAELGGAVLLEVLGYEKESDRGGCYEYITSYAAAAKVEPLKACEQLIGRVCAAVAAVLDAAERIAGVGQGGEQDGEGDAAEAAEMEGELVAA